MRRGLKYSLSILAAFLVLAGAAYAFDRSQAGTVPAGVTISGVRVGGMGRDAAVAQVRGDLTQRLG
ncbi:MAG: vanomycin resistance protein VanB, partial [Actinomycetes bacterium]